MSICKLCGCKRTAYIRYNSKWMCKEHYERISHIDKTYRKEGE